MNEEILSVDNFDEDVLRTDEGNIDLVSDVNAETGNNHSYTYLQMLIDNATDELTLDSNITFDSDYDLSPDNPYYGIVNFTNGVIINKTLKIIGNAFTIDGSGASRIFYITAGDCVLNNTNFINGKSTSYGGAIYCEVFTKINGCNFTNNSGLDYGGAIYFENMAIVEACNFKANQVTKYNKRIHGGGAIYFKTDCNISNSYFEDNTASYNGGAIYSSSQSNVINCIFKNNNASNSGGAIYASQSNCDNCIFDSNYARGGGAAYFSSLANLTNSEFSHNRATNEDGGAVYFNSVSNAINSTFLDNIAKWGNGGAIHFNVNGNVDNCNFTKNTADTRGGAVNFVSNGDLLNSNFLNNSGDTGGAAYIKDLANVYCCNFTDNSASQKAGALFTGSTSNVINSNFIANKASEASAIQVKAYAEITNSSFFNNKANASALILTKNASAVNITFKGKNNLLNAIYSDEDIIFKNVLYWGEQGIMNTDDVAVYKSEGAPGQNITIKVYIDGVMVLETTNVTDKYGSFYFDPGYNTSYLIVVYHNDDSYYSEIDNSTIAGKPDPTILIEVQNTKVGKTEQINITVNGKKNENVTVFVNDEKYNVDNGTLFYIPQEQGLYTVTVSWNGDEDYVPGYNSTQFEVEKNDIEISIDEVVEDVYVYSPVTFTAHLSANVTGKVIFRIDYRNHEVNITNSNVCSFTYVPLDTGNITVMAIFPGNSAYLSNYSDIVYVNVNKIKTEFIANPITTVYNVNKNLVITLKDSNGNILKGVNVTVKFRGTKTVTTDENGQIKLSSYNLSPNTYAAKVTFAGDGNHAGSTGSFKVTVKKATPKLTAKNKIFKAKTKTKKYLIVLKTNKNKAMKKVKVYLKVKGKTYVAKTNNKGKALFKITNLTKKGKFAAVIKYLGNKYYNKATKKVIMITR